MNRSLPKLGIAAMAVAMCAMLPASVFPQQQTRPDLNGIWGGGVARLTPTTCQKSVNAFANENVERFAAGGAKGGQKWITFEQDCSIQNRGRVNKPLYKPQYWEKVRLHDYYANAGGKWIEYADPEWQNLPRGVPRLGPPNKIVKGEPTVVIGS